MRNKSTIFMTRAALIAALYVALTFASALFGLASGVIQFRISEMLCILPLFMPEAVVGLTLGCFIANLATNAIIWDILFGTIATLIGAIGTRILRNLPKKLIWLAPLPTVLFHPICA